MKLWSSNYKLKIGIINNINNIYIHSYKFYIAILGFSLVQLPVVSDSLRPHEPQHARPPCPSPAPRVHPNSCPSGQWCHPAISSSVFPFSSCPQSFPSSGSFPMSQLLCIRWPKYWNFSFNISSFNEYSGLISFRMDWLGLLVVQGTLKSLLQHHSSKASIIWCLAFFIVQISHPRTTTGKTIALTRLTFIGQVMSLLFNMVSSFVIGFLPGSKHHLISWLQSPSAVIKVCHSFHCCPIYLPWGDGTDAMIFILHMK